MHSSFNPSTSLPEVIKKTFSGRDHIVKIIVKDIKANTKRKHLQHCILIGPRGIGKTHFLRYLSIYVGENKELAEKWLPLQAAEEEYHRILSLRDFFEVVALHLLETLEKNSALPVPEEKRTEFVEKLEDLSEQLTDMDDKAALSETLHLLEAFRKSTGVKLLLLMDNMDEVLGRRIKKDEEQSKLRNILMNGDWLMVIGAAPTYFKEITDYNKPFYNFFRSIELEPLKEDAEIDLICRLASLKENTKYICEQLRDDAEYAARIKAVSYLTGGNPRLTVMLFEIIRAGDVEEADQFLEGLLNSITPYFQAKMDKLTPQQQKIVDAMSRLTWDEGFVKRLKKKKVSEAIINMLMESSIGILPTPTAIAASTRLPVNQVNTLLRRLDEMGVVKKAGLPEAFKKEREKRLKRSDARHTVYQLTEPLFQVYHQYRYSRAFRKRYAIFVRFLQIWFGEKGVYDEAQRLMGRLKDSFAGEPEKATGLIEYTRYLHAAAEGEEKEKIGSELFNTLLEARKLDECERVIKEDFKGDGGGAVTKLWNRLGLACAKEKFFEKGAHYFEKAVEGSPDKDRYQYLSNLGAALSKLGEMRGEQKYLTEALGKLSEAHKLKPDLWLILFNLGNTLSSLGKLKREKMHFEEAFANYQNAVNIKPNIYELLLNWGNALSDLGRLTEEGVHFEEACEKYRAALKIKPDDLVALCNWGTTLRTLGNMTGNAEYFEEACEKYRAAVKIKPDYHEVLSDWGNVLSELGSMTDKAGHLEEAIEKYRAALEIKPDRHEALNGWGTTLSELGRLTGKDDYLTEACERYRAALEINPDTYEALNNWGNTLFNLGSMTGEGSYYYEAYEKILQGLQIQDHPIINASAVRVALNISSEAVKGDNAGTAKEYFKKALEHGRKAEKKLFYQQLFYYFRSWIAPSRINLMEELLLQIDASEDEFLKGIAAIVGTAYLYWEQDGDAEILERMPEEQRNIVAEIIAEGEKRDEKAEKKTAKKKK